MFKAFKDEEGSSDWRVEAISEEDCYIAIFSGPYAEDRAKTYASWMNETGAYS